MQRHLFWRVQQKTVLPELPAPELPVVEAPATRRLSLLERLNGAHSGDESMGRWLRRLLMSLFLGGQVFLRVCRGKSLTRHIMPHLVTVGPLSLGAVFGTTVSAGAIFAFQTGRSLLEYGSISGVLGQSFGIAFCRELAPLLTAAVLVGRVGSAYAAELGAMEITEQINALRMLRTDPIDYLVTPRVLACVFMLPIMTIFGLVFGIFGGMTAAYCLFHFSPERFLEDVRTSLTIIDLLSVLLKSTIFGVLLSVSCCNWGLTTVGGVRGVGYSTTEAVVTTWITLFVVNFFLSILLF